MKLTRVTCCLLVLLLSLVAFAFPTSAHAAASASTTVIRFQSATAVATFDSTSGCIDTFVELDGTQSGTSSRADIFIDQFDNCTFKTLFLGFGSTSNPDFQVSGLASASLSATISVLDGVSGKTFNVSVGQTWTATGPPTIEVGTFVFRTKHVVETFHMNDTFRDASASGTVSNGTTNFTPSPSVSPTQIASFKSGDVTITHS